MQAEKVRFPFVWACNFMNRIMTCKDFSFSNVKMVHVINILSHKKIRKLAKRQLKSLVRRSFFI